MSIKDLERFLNDDGDNDSSIDWVKGKNEWINAVNQLYTSITAWLKPLTEKPNSNLKISLETMILSEEDLGEYEIKKMIISTKGQRVVLEPIGTKLIGARGRIDMKGTYGTVRFLLVDKRLTKPNLKVRYPEFGQILEEQKQYTPIEWEWKIATFPPNVRYIPLNEETFSTSLLSVISYG